MTVGGGADGFAPGESIRRCAGNDRTRGPEWAHEASGVAPSPRFPVNSWILAPMGRFGATATAPSADAFLRVRFAALARFIVGAFTAGALKG